MTSMLVADTGIDVLSPAFPAKSVHSLSLYQPLNSYPLRDVEGRVTDASV